MNRKTSAFFAFTWPVAVFLVALGAAVLFAGPACGGDDLAALTKALEAQNAAKPAGCTCPECNCWTGEDCGAECAFGGKKPKLGDRKVTDDPSRPFVYGWGDAYGYGHVLGYYRPAVAPVNYAPNYAPNYAQPMLYQVAPRFFGGGGNCGPSG